MSIKNKTTNEIVLTPYYANLKSKQICTAGDTLQINIRDVNLDVFRIVAGLTFYLTQRMCCLSMSKVYSSDSQRQTIFILFAMCLCIYVFFLFK